MTFGLAREHPSGLFHRRRTVVVQSAPQRVVYVEREPNPIGQLAGVAGLAIGASLLAGAISRA